MIAALDPPQQAQPTDSRSLLAARLKGVVLMAEEDPGWWSVAGRALGSGFEILFRTESQREAQAFKNAALAWLVEFEARYSRFLADSEVSQINHRAGTGVWTETDQTGEALLNLCAHTHFLTQGAFDATSLPLSRLWDWKAKHERLPTDAEIADAKALVGWTMVEREPGRVRLPRRGMEIDLGGVGKEYAVDALVHLAQRHGIADALIDLGRDIRVLGQPPEGGGWVIGLESPEDGAVLGDEGDDDATLVERRCHGVVRVKDGIAVATSGDYRRRFTHAGRSYGHIIDCRTGRPVTHGTRSVTVVSRTCVAAGCMSTAAMVQGGLTALNTLERLPEAEALLWHEGKALKTRGFFLQPVPADWNE